MNFLSWNIFSFFLSSSDISKAQKTDLASRFFIWKHNRCPKSTKYKLAFDGFVHSSHKFLVERMKYWRQTKLETQIFLNCESERRNVNIFNPKKEKLFELKRNVWRLIKIASEMSVLWWSQLSFRWRHSFEITDIRLSQQVH